MFELFASQLSELFWELVELCVETYGYTLERRASFIRSRAAIYASTFVDSGLLLESLIAFIDCTKTQIKRLEGANYSQQSVFWGYKRNYCLIHQTMSTPDGLVDGLHGPVEGRRHNLALLYDIAVEKSCCQRCVSSMIGNSTFTAIAHTYLGLVCNSNLLLDFLLQNRLYSMQRWQRSVGL